jgi:hypothetical protein
MVVYLLVVSGGLDYTAGLLTWQANFHQEIDILSGGGYNAR